MHSSKCWRCSCQADEVLIELHADAGLHPVPPLHVLSGRGDDIADIIEILVSDKGAWIRNDVIDAEGGFHRFA